MSACATVPHTAAFLTRYVPVLSRTAKTTVVGCQLLLTTASDLIEVETSQIHFLCFC